MDFKGMIWLGLLDGCNNMLVVTCYLNTMLHLRSHANESCTWNLLLVLTFFVICRYRRQWHKISWHLYFCKCPSSTDVLHSPFWCIKHGTYSETKVHYCVLRKDCLKMWSVKRDLKYAWLTGYGNGWFTVHFCIHFCAVCDLSCQYLGLYSVAW
jgi:hypothetical protein